MSGTVVQEALAAMRAAHDALAACDIDSLTPAELLAAGDELQTLTCQLPTQSHRILARLQAEATPKEMGAKSWKDVLRIRWRISSTEANRRLTEAALLGPRRTLDSGNPCNPCWRHRGRPGPRAITPEHVEVIRKSITKLPGFVDAGTRDQFEADLVRTAAGVGPKELDDVAELTLFLLDQDGPAPDDTERNRKRGITIGRQRPRRQRSPLSGELHPRSAGGIGGALRQVRRPRHVQPR